MNLTVRILIGMVGGLLLGLTLQGLSLGPDHFLNRVLVGDVLDAGGRLFISSLMLMVVPLVFVSLVCGAASLGKTGSVGRLGGKTLGLYLMTTAIAVTIAITLGVIFLSGATSDVAAESLSFEAKTAPSVKDTLVNIMPTNPVAAMAEGAMLQIITFALLFGVALSKSGGAGERVYAWFQGHQRSPHAAHHHAHHACALWGVLPDGEAVFPGLRRRNLEAHFLLCHRHPWRWWCS